MVKHTYHPNEKCTSWIAAELMHMSEHTGRRRMRDLRVAKGYKPKHFVSVGEFCEYYNLNVVS